MLQREEYDDDGYIIEHGFNLEDYPKNLEPKESADPSTLHLSFYTAAISCSLL